MIRPRPGYGLAATWLASVVDAVSIAVIVERRDRRRKLEGNGF